MGDYAPYCQAHNRQGFRACRVGYRVSRLLTGVGSNTYRKPARDRARLSVRRLGHRLSRWLVTVKMQKLQGCRVIGSPVGWLGHCLIGECLGVRGSRNSRQPPPAFQIVIHRLAELSTGRQKNRADQERTPPHCDFGRVWWGTPQQNIFPKVKPPLTCGYRYCE